MKFLGALEPPGSPSPVSVVRRGVSGRSSITVSWAEPDRPNGIILEYEIKYFEKRQDTVSTSHPEKQEKTLEGSRREQDSGYTIIKSQQTEMVVEGLKPSSAYIFQVRARTSAGYGAFSRRFEFQTSPYCKRCGYSKAKQDPEEEKMHFHNGLSLLVDPKWSLWWSIQLEQDSGYTIIKSQQTEMVVEGLKPSSAYIFQLGVNQPH
ncbi:hypothetical protein CRUP_006613 [Coryphaenoides rupestris]|nr:hypothetical protein CRUP_006613 [Coryphaenoides rupestris]